MFKILFFFILFFFLLYNSTSINAQEQNSNTDSSLLNEAQNINKNKKDPRTIEEKLREKLHLPPTKKIYYHNINKSAQPLTEDDYYQMAIDKKRKDFVIPEPSFESHDDIILPDPFYRVVMYNSPPGQRNIDITRIVSEHVATAPGILSPDKSKLVYTKAFFYPTQSQTASAAYLININSSSSDPYKILFNTNVIQGNVKPFLTVGMDEISQYQFKTLFPIDWSKDSSKIAFKEKIGSNLSETWKTNIIVYDFQSKTSKKLTAVREAIIYFWRQNYNIDLKDYMWDIFPIGWDKNSPDRLILYAYAFSQEKPFFLGTWSIDSNENKSLLISLTSTNAQIDLNGFGLKEIKLEN